MKSGAPAHITVLTVILNTAQSASRCILHQELTTIEFATVPKFIFTEQQSLDSMKISVPLLPAWMVFLQHQIDPGEHWKSLDLASMTQPSICRAKAAARTLTGTTACQPTSAGGKKDKTHYRIRGMSHKASSSHNMLLGKLLRGRLKQ